MRGNTYGEGRPGSGRARKSYLLYKPAPCPSCCAHVATGAERRGRVAEAHAVPACVSESREHNILPSLLWGSLVCGGNGGERHCERLRCLRCRERGGPWRVHVLSARLVVRLCTCWRITARLLLDISSSGVGGRININAWRMHAWSLCLLGQCRRLNVRGTWKPVQVWVGRGDRGRAPLHWTHPSSISPQHPEMSTGMGTGGRHACPACHSSPGGKPLHTDNPNRPPGLGASPANAPCP